MLAVAGMALFSTSCGPGGATSPSGFLSNYSQLGGGQDPAGGVAAYMNPKADFKDYDSIVLDPVTTIVGSDQVDPRVAEQLASYLGGALRSELGRELKMVGAPGPRTLRVRVALTDVIAGQPAATPVTTVHTQPRAMLQGAVGEAAGFIGSVSFEGETLDSMTGERLTAVSDQRLGSKREVSASTDWVWVRTLVDESADRLAERLASAQAR